jgi:hypothetical protein
MELWIDMVTLNSKRFIYILFINIKLYLLQNECGNIDVEVADAIHKEIFGSSNEDYNTSNEFKKDSNSSSGNFKEFELNIFQRCLEKSMLPSVNPSSDFDPISAYTKTLPNLNSINMREYQFITLASIHKRGGNITSTALEAIPLRTPSPTSRTSLLIKRFSYSGFVDITSHTTTNTPSSKSAIQVDPAVGNTSSSLHELPMRMIRKSLSYMGNPNASKAEECDVMLSKEPAVVNDRCIYGRSAIEEEFRRYSKHIIFISYCNNPLSL